MKKRIVSSLLVLIMLFSTFLPPQAIAAANRVEINVPADAAVYAEDKYKDAIEVVKAYSDYYNVTEEKLKDIQLGKPFVIYEIDETEQDEIYYYPLMDSEGNTILLMSIMGTTEGWSMSISEEWVDELEDIGDITSEYIFYKSEDNVYAENKKEEFCIAGGIDAEIESFKEKGYKAKKKIIANASKRFVKTDVNNIPNTEETRRATYTPSFSTSTSSSKICALHNKKGQGKKKICWAATVATIVNYRNGSNITAAKVAKAMGLNNTGAYCSEAKQALKMYGISYENLNDNAGNKMTWKFLKKNIKNKYPIYVHAVATKSAHAVTAYGYAIAGGTKYVVLWNSGNKSTTTVEFKNAGTTFEYNNEVYTWAKSISKF